MLISSDINSTKQMVQQMVQKTEQMASVDTNFNTTAKAWPASSSEWNKHCFSGNY